MIIILRIIGGLGNKLFRYPSSLAFAKLYNLKFFSYFIFFSCLKYINPEGFLLNKLFNIDIPKPDIMNISWFNGNKQPRNMLPQEWILI